MDGNKLVESFKNWVVIGDVKNEKKYANKILNKFKNSGYTVAGVNPKAEESVYKKLSDVPFKIEAIDLCINSIQGLEYLKEAKALNIKYVLIQPGAGSNEILNYCKENDIVAVEGCALVSLGRLIL